MTQGDGEVKQGDGEVKQAFTWRFFLITAIVALIAGVVTIFTDYLPTLWSNDEKVIDVSTSVSSNIASLPEAIGKKLEIYLSVSSKQKELVRSLFTSEFTVTNNTSQGIDVFEIHVKAPERITLSPDPALVTIPESLLSTIKWERVPNTKPHQAIYKVDLLNPDQSLTFSFLGYSTEQIDSMPLDVTVKKLDWRQRTVSKSEQPAVADRGESLFSLFSPVLIGVLAALTSLIVSRFK
jgi:hypothetical protein